MTGPTRTRQRPEEEFFEQVRQLMTMFGWTFYRHLNSKGTTPGWPDLVIVRAPQILYRELKSATGTVSPPQRACLHALRECGCDVGVWRPVDLKTRIPAELSRVRRAA